MCKKTVVRIKESQKCQEAIKKISSNLGLKTDGLEIFIEEPDLKNEKAKFNAIVDILRDFDCNIFKIYLDRGRK